MKTIIKLIVGIGLLFLVGQGCNDLLDNPKPDTSLTQDVVLNDAGSVEALRFELYDRMQGSYWTRDYMLGPGAIADDFVNLRGTSRYEGLTGNQVGAGLGSWGGAYSYINIANILIDGIPEGIQDELGAETLELYEAEGLFFRAFILHQMSKAYGYEPGASPSGGQGAGFDLSVIVRTVPTLGLDDVDFPARSTAADVYNQIASDLNAAIPLLPEANESSVNFITRPAAEALLARVELYRGNHGAANTQAQNAIDNSNARMATPGEVATMFDETVGANPEAIFILDIDPNQDSNGSGSLAGYTATFWNAMIPSQEVLATYDAADERNAWFGDCESVNKGDCTNEYPRPDGTGFDAQELQKWNGELTLHTNDVPYFRISELKLIQAEARAQDAGVVTQGAVDALNDVRTNRGLADRTLADYGGGTDLEGFMDDVLLERRREFIGEGHRFWDLKRLQRDIPKPSVTPLAPELDFQSFRVLDNIPDSEVDLNPELVQNPGY